MNASELFAKQSISHTSQVLWPFLSGFAVLLLSLAIVAPLPRDEAIAQCDSDVAATRMAGCTELIRSQLITERERALAYSRRGGAHLSASNWTDAIADFTEATRREPDDVVHRKQLAYTYLAQGDSLVAAGDDVRAILSFDEVLKADPGNQAALVGKAGANLRMGGQEAAFKDLNAVRELKPPYSTILARLHAQRGIERHAKGDTSSAILSYNLAIARDPTATEIYFRRANAFNEQGQYADARRDFDVVLKSDTGNAAAYLGRGHAKLALGDNVAAIEDFSLGLDLEPRNIPLLLAHALALEQDRRSTDALAAYQKVLDVDPANSIATAAKQRLWSAD